VIIEGFAAACLVVAVFRPGAVNVCEVCLGIPCSSSEMGDFLSALAGGLGPSLVT